MEILGIRPEAELGRAYAYMRDHRIEKGPMDFETARDALLEMASPAGPLTRAPP
jgi:hypothetical protein